jgi:hypothetical protein
MGQVDAGSRKIFPRWYPKERDWHQLPTVSSQSDQFLRMPP